MKLKISELDDILQQAKCTDKADDCDIGGGGELEDVDEGGGDDGSDDGGKTGNLSPTFPPRESERRDAAEKGSGKKNSTPRQFPMIVTRHPVSAKKRKTATPSKGNADDTEDDDVDGPNPEDANSDDDAIFSNEPQYGPRLARKTRKFSTLGFLMTLCTCGLNAASTVSDVAKGTVIAHIEAVHGVAVSVEPWATYSAIQHTKILRSLNRAWSKHINAWRLCMQRLAIS